MQDASYLEPPRREKRCVINVLPPELLLEIFLNNTELEDNWDDKRLTTARYTSQVCRGWRSLILASASIWGRLLNIRKIGQATDEWREELRSRVGDAMLWITGEISHTCPRSFLTTLLKERWANVQIFDIVIYQPEALVEIWPILQSKAPNLESFAVEAYSSQTLPIIPPIFDDVAPRLRHFQGRPLKTMIPFSPVAPWLSNLRSISFSRTHTVYFIFSVLKSAPLLEIVEITGSENSPAEAVTTGEDANAISVHLPRLKRLRISQRHFTEIFSLLKHIIPPPSCGLVVKWMLGLKTGTRDDIKRTNTVMVKWVSAFINNHRPTSIILQQPREAFGFLSIEIRAPEDPYPIPLFGAEIYTHRPSGYFALRKLATCPGLSFVQHLTLVRMPPEAGKELVSLFQAFSAVTAVTINRSITTLHAFKLHDSYRPRQVPIFPLLQTIQVRNLDDFTLSVGRMFGYLEYRVKVGLPVSTLDFSYWIGCILTEDQKDCLRQRQVDGLIIQMP